MLRSKVREDVNLEREKLRTVCLDACRVGLGEIEKHFEDVLISHPEQTKEIALKIKHKKNASEQDIYKLSYAFIQSADNIKTFIEVPGALKVIVKELTCSKSKLTIAALECLCNLSLGERYICDKIINEAGFYIVTLLHNEDYSIKRTSLWILANLLCEGGKSVKRLLNAKILELLWADYMATEREENFCMDAAICLYLTYKISHCAQPTFFKENFTLKSPTSIGAEYHLLILFNANVLQGDLSESEKLYLLNFSLFNLKNVDLDSFPGKLRTLYGLRIFANMLSLYRDQANFLETVQSVMNSMQINISALLNNLFSYHSDCLSLETLWLTRNWLDLLIVNNQPIENVVESLKIYK